MPRLRGIIRSPRRPISHADQTGLHRFVSIGAGSCCRRAADRAALIQTIGSAAHLGGRAINKPAECGSLCLHESNCSHFSYSQSWHDCFLCSSCKQLDVLLSSSKYGSWRRDDVPASVSANFESGCSRLRAAQSTLKRLPESAPALPRKAFHQTSEVCCSKPALRHLRLNHTGFGQVNDPESCSRACSAMKDCAAFSYSPSYEDCFFCRASLLDDAASTKEAATCDHVNQPSSTHRPVLLTSECLTPTHPHTYPGARPLLQSTTRAGRGICPSRQRERSASSS